MARLRVEVVYATRDRQHIVAVDLPEDARAVDAVRASGLSEQHPELDAQGLRLGVFGSEVAPDALLADGDRVEIYRTLAIDPKEARRARVRSKARR
jgi:uncharacterized protein